MNINLIEALVYVSNKIQINKRLGTIYLPAGMQIDFGGIAKGYIAQWVIDYLAKNGIKQALVDAGGDIVMSQAPMNKKGWLIGVNVPETKDVLLDKKLVLSNCSVATSGDVFQNIKVKDLTYSHIIWFYFKRIITINIHCSTRII